MKKREDKKGLGRRVNEGIEKRELGNEEEYGVVE